MKDKLTDEKEHRSDNSVYVAIAGEVVNRRSVLLRNFVLNGQESASNPLLHIHAKRCRELNMRTLLIFIAILGFSCSSSETKMEVSMEDKFTWNVQLAGYDHSKADPKGEITLEEFIKELDSFPWMAQIDKAAEMPDKCAPTLTVKDLKSRKNFWISMAGTSTTEHGYILGYIYPKTKKGFFGFGKEKEINWLEMRASQDKTKVLKCVNYFFERNFDSLEQTLHQMDDFGQMEAKDLTAM